MRKIKNSEYEFVREEEGYTFKLTVYIQYDKKTYDIVQEGQEGIFCRHNTRDTFRNIAYMRLAIEALQFIEAELFDGKFTPAEGMRGMTGATGSMTVS